jgi:hypothetical protein
MSFYSTQDYPNRKDHRKPGRCDASCNPGGSCPWCQENRRIREMKEKERCAVEDMPDERAWDGDD